MDVLLTGFIAVAAMLLGSYTTYLFLGRTAEEARAFERAERRRQEHLDACSSFAAAVTDLKKGLINLWFYSWDASASEAAKAAGAECDRLGASTGIARFRVQLVSGDPELIALADAALTAASALLKAADRSDLHARETEFEAAVKAFITTASERTRQLPSPPPSRQRGMPALFARDSSERSSEKGAQWHGAAPNRTHRAPAQGVPHARTRQPP